MKPKNKKRSLKGHQSPPSASFEASNTHTHCLTSSTEDQIRKYGTMAEEDNKDDAAAAADAVEVGVGDTDAEEVTDLSSR